MRHSCARYLAAACVPLLTTCCPSVWFTVTRRDPGPRPYLPVPAVSETPIQYSPAYDNRFDILDGARPAAARLFDDRAPDRAAQRRALDARRAIESTYQTRKREGIHGVHATIMCLDKECSLRFVSKDDTVPPIGDALDGTRSITLDVSGHHDDYAINSCESVDTNAPAVAATQQEAGVCHTAGAREVKMTLAAPIDCYGACKSNTDVSVDAWLAPLLARPAFTFIQLSDLQMRDGDVTLDDADLSHRLDWIIQSFEYDPDQMFFGRYMIEAIFATINEAATSPTDKPENRPSLIMHTGDLVDAGVTIEEEMAHVLVDRLAIPFFDVLGNHDVLVFGNMLPPKTLGGNIDDGCVKARTVLAPYISYFQQHQASWLPTNLCTEKTSDVELIASETLAKSKQNFIQRLKHEAPRVAPRSSCPLRLKSDDTSSTQDHGFDLNDDKGYYAFTRTIELGGAQRDVFFIALDSLDLMPGEGGTGGRIRNKQLRWLSSVLACVGPKDLVFLFAHHGVSDTVIGDGPPPRDRNAPNALERMLVEHNRFRHNIVGFFYGHHHSHAICKDGQGGPRPTVCSSFYEVETGSIVEFPQEGRQVRLEYVGSGVGYIEVTTFGANLKPGDEFSKAVEMARRGAERDYCRTSGPHPRCSEDLRPYRTDGHDTNARLFFTLPEDTGYDP